MTADNMQFLLLWFCACIVLENVDPLQGGYFRLKDRTQRRPTMPVESPLVFYPKYGAEIVWKHARLAREIWRFYRLRRRLKHDPEARNYMDQALTPVTGDEAETLDLFSIVR